MRLASSTVLVGFLAACATAETPEGMPSDGSTSGSAGESTGMSGSAGAVGSSGSGSGGSSSAGTTSASGTFGNGGTQPNGGTFTQGGTLGVSGSAFGGGTGGSASGSGGAGGAGGSAAGAGGKAGAGGGGAGGKAGAGGGGTGGTAPTGCPAKTAWTATAFVHADTCETPTSDYCGPPERAIDGDATKRFSTGEARKGTEWLQVDFTKTVTVSQVTLITPNTDFTAAYEVRLSNDAGTIATSPVVVAGTGMQGTTTIAIPAGKSGRYLRINQTMAMAGWWSVYELNVDCQ